MAQWKNDDREESKPTWLSSPQRRQCVRTNRGWELPVGASVSNLAGQFRGQLNLGGQTAPNLARRVALGVRGCRMGA